MYISVLDKRVGNNHIQNILYGTTLHIVQFMVFQFGQIDLLYSNFDVIYLDFEMNFDSVSHKLISKLWSLGIRGTLWYASLPWIEETVLVCSNNTIKYGASSLRSSPGKHT